MPDFREHNSKYGQNEINETGIADSSSAGNFNSIRLHSQQRNPACIINLIFILKSKNNVILII
jgi:hypothetical protein